MPAVSMHKPEFELVIFDCDGVLIDSEIISASILIEQLKILGIDVGFDYVQRHFLGRSFKWVESEIRAGFGITLPPKFEDEYRRDLLAAFETGLCSVDGIEEVLGSLAVVACVATSSSPERVARSLELAGLSEPFGENVFTASEVENGKPAPDLFLHASRAMGVGPQSCLVIEDSLSGLRAALAAEMTVWRFVGGSHLKSSKQSVPDDLARVPAFDRWSAFFEMAPELRRHDNGVG